MDTSQKQLDVSRKLLLASINTMVKSKNIGEVKNDTNERDVSVSIELHSKTLHAEVYLVDCGYGPESVAVVKGASGRGSRNVFFSKETRLKRRMKRAIEQFLQCGSIIT